MTQRGGVLFDVDGTLVDTAYVHTLCWSQAFAAHGFHPPMARVHRAVGMGSDLLVPYVLRDDPDEAVVTSVTQEHDALFEAWYDRITVLPGARALVERCAQDGLAVVLATSSRPEDLARMREVLGVDEYVHGVTSSEDVDTAKPSPDIIKAALERVGLAPECAVVIGDAVWDGQSAERAGTGFVGLESGGVSADELMRAGAIMVAADPLELLVRYDETPLARLG